MKKYIYCLIFTTLAMWQAHASDVETDGGGVVTNNLQMSIRLDGKINEIKTNQPCILLIRYKNISTNEIFWVYERNGIEHDPDYSFSVISPSGKDISPDMKHIRHGDSGGNNPVLPEQSIEVKFNLSLLCKFDETGTYKIIAGNNRIWAVKKQTMFTIVSNPLYVSVVSDK